MPNNKPLSNRKNNLSAVDDLLKSEGGQPAIGLILRKNKLDVEYALRDFTKPIGVSSFITRVFLG